jgi:hypothetical protein
MNRSLTRRIQRLPFGLALLGLLLAITGCEEAAKVTDNRYTPPWVTRYPPQRTYIHGILGYSFGDEMLYSDLERLERIYEEEPSYKTVHWINWETGNEFAVTPEPSYRLGGSFCREAMIQWRLEDHFETIQQRVCRLRTGRWIPA